MASPGLSRKPGLSMSITHLSTEIWRNTRCLSSEMSSCRMPCHLYLLSMTFIVCTKHNDYILLYMYNIYVIFIYINICTDSMLVYMCPCLLLAIACVIYYWLDLCQLRYTHTYILQNYG